MTASKAPGDRTGQEPVVVCEQCGTRQHPEQTFCESCNAVLRWGPATAAPRPSSSGEVLAGQVMAAGQVTGGAAPSGASADEAPLGQAPGVAPSGQPSHAPSGQASSGQAPSEPGPSGQAAGSGRDDREDDDTLETVRTAPAPTGPGAMSGGIAGGGPGVGSWPQGAGTWPPAADPVADAERARALLVPVADPQAQPGPPSSVAPVLPGQPAPARPEVRTPGAQVVYGGVACLFCGTPNPPERHFCSRCAMSMAARPPGAARRPWWRRMLDYRNREAPWAGDRPRLGRNLGRIVRWVAWAAVLALAVTGLFNVGSGISATRDHFAKRVPVAPDSATASRSYPQHPASLAFDKISNTWWGPGIAGTGEGVWLEAHFQDSVNLLAVGITAGESTHADTLAKSALPHRIEARITMDNGKVTTKELILDQASGFQLRGFRFHNVKTVRFTLGTAYNTGPKKQVAIAEIEFFSRSQGGSS